MSQVERRLLTSQEAAAYLRIAVTTLHTWSHKDTGPPSIKIGSRLRYDQSSLDAWVERQSRGGDAA